MGEKIAQFHFRGLHRHLMILPRSEASPQGYTLVDKCSAHTSCVKEIAPHLAKDRNALFHAQRLLALVGQPTELVPRQVAGKLSKAIQQGLLSVYVEMAKDFLHTSEETATAIGSTSSAQPQVKASAKGKASQSQPTQGQQSNYTATDIPIADQTCRSDPVSMFSGEEILAVVDFEIAAVMPLRWQRLYRSSRANVDSGLGFGWRHNFSVQLEQMIEPAPKVGPKQQDRQWLELTDEEGRIHVFDPVKLGQTSYQLATGFALTYQALDKYVLIKPDDSHWSFRKYATISGDVWRLDTISNLNGQYFQLSYDAHSRLALVSTSPKRGIALGYSADGHLLTVNGFHLDDKGVKHHQTQPLAQYEYCQHGCLIAATNSQGLTERYSYVDGQSAYREQTDTREQHAPVWLLKQRTRASGYSHYFQWQINGVSSQCVKQWGDQNTYQYQFSYHSHQQGRLTRCIDSLGNEECFVHDAQGRLLEFLNAENHLTQYRYDRWGRKIAKVDPLGHETRYQYNSKGQLQAHIQADGGKTVHQYNALGQRIVTIDPSGAEYRRRFDATGRLLSETLADGRLRQYRYNDQGLLVEFVNEQGVTVRNHWGSESELLAQQIGAKLTRYSYDAMGRVNAVVDPQGLVTALNRNQQGQIVEQRQYHHQRPEAYIITEFKYDKAGRIVSKTCPQRFPRQLGVDGSNRTHATRWYYQGLSQPSEMHLSETCWLKYHYDGERNLTKLQRSDGACIDFRYNRTEQISKVIGFDGREQHFEFDAADRLSSIVDGEQRIIKLTRDALGRVIKHSSMLLGDASDKRLVTHSAHNHFHYDSLGRVARAHNDTSHLQLQYHRNGKVEQARQGVWQFTYRYNQQGLRESLHLPDGTIVNYRYDEFGQLTNMTLRAQGRYKKLQPLIARVYNRAGLVTQQTLGNGVELQQVFDEYSRLTQQHWQHPDLGSVQYCQYQYDEAGNLVNRKQNTPAKVKGYKTQNCDMLSSNSVGNLSEAVAGLTVENRYQYNVLNQLIHNKSVISSAEHEVISDDAYYWDDFGNPCNTQNSSDEHRAVTVKQDRLLALGEQQFRYDQCGNQVQSIAKGERQHRRFNALNQLVEINVNDRLIRYQYDALGRRIAKFDQGVRIDYLWDGDQLIGEHQAGIYTWYIFEPDTFLPIACLKQDQIYWYHLDQLGTPCAAFDSDIKLVWHTNSDPFGLTLQQNIADEPDTISFNNPLRFQGQYFDQESGLHYNRYRYYCPKQQRFLNQDPIGLAGGLNHYQYAPNPINWVDPFGLLCKEGRDTLSAMLDSLVGAGIDQHTKDKILQSAIDSACITDPEGKVKFCKADGINNLNYNYTVQSMDEASSGLTIRHKMGDKFKEIELSIAEFAGMHEFDGELVNEAWAEKGRIKEDNARPLIEAQKVTGSEQVYQLTEQQQQALQQHCDERDDAMCVRDKHRRGTDAYNQQIPHVNKASAKIGEKAADMAVKAKYPDYQLIHPDDLDNSDSVSGTFDMVYQNPQGDVIIVEAKGGQSTLGKKQIGDQDYQQGTTNYAAAITESMKANREANAATDRKAAKAIQKAAWRKKQVQYLHIETPIAKTDTGSSIGEVNISEFDIDVTKLVG
ncbi:RHS repeat-associated core domain-containing protein [Shewanella waksmanii]|uniref:RHS repeat-associated core domain-containing protein n=1 Tax=Shewanella waksmanii TaxID=213783 RepID=UPI003736FD2B